MGFVQERATGFRRQASCRTSLGFGRIPGKGLGFRICLTHPGPLTVFWGQATDMTAVRTCGTPLGPRDFRKRSRPGPGLFRSRRRGWLACGKRFPSGSRRTGGEALRASFGGDPDRSNTST